ncbi:S1/P1 Nuclease [Mucilaginibacter sp. HMF5004]|uniref:S1/P1 Nuclease n=1 Tax=Mucilaginibacter rivuli TaxID=2857527 RepID=UPI001C5E0A76|nr:S1/P1 Nuclease [Mucilaginibacter rivuli]MBW4889483.1 S1/P1 Nuclease [Mucilaginibacter rivuli]
MKLSKATVYFSGAALILFIAGTLISWGKFGHAHINRAAVMALPPAMQAYYFNHIDYITQEANVPDVRKYTYRDTAEFPRHFIHMEDLGNLDTVPKSYAAAMARYNKRFFIKQGILPWNIQFMMDKLTLAFKQKHAVDILFLSADLGHYIGDAYMPLHVSSNHDGLLTNRKGIHAMFESQIPEQFGEAYNFHTKGAVYIADIEKETWRIMSESLKAADTLLQVDRDLYKNLPDNKIYELDAAGKIKLNQYNEPVHTYQYCKLYQAGLHGMIERKLRASIATTASFWYTAWVNAGKPDLSKIDKKELTLRNAQGMAQERTLWKKGKLFGIDTDDEFN